MFDELLDKRIQAAKFAYEEEFENLAK